MVIHVTKAKANPEVFWLAADKLGIKPENCIVLEDAVAGISRQRSKRLALESEMPKYCQKAKVIIFFKISLQIAINHF